MSRLLEDSQRVGRSYVVERYLGEGAYAEVYRVRHRYLGRLAMKVFKHIGTAAEIERMLGEAILLSRLSHPNIVRIFDADTVHTPSGECGFFTMEYVAGGTLHDFWSSHGSRFIPVGSVVEVMRQVCEGMSVAHRQRPPIVHRDLTLQNILVGYEADGLRARISDFGLAKRADPMTWLVSAQGTLVFKSPEALRDPLSDSPAGDVWALGTIAYLLLTDILPFEYPDGPEAFLGTHIDAPPRSPRDLNPYVDEELAAVVLGALQPLARDRTPDADALAAGFTRWLDRADPGTGSTDRRGPVSQTRSRKIAPRQVADRSGAARKVEEAHRMARVGMLREAADLMEEAFNDGQGLRARYGSRVAQWRKGVVT